MNCITCNRPFPKGQTEFPEYFAQSHPESAAADDLRTLHDDTALILEHVSALFHALLCVVEREPRDKAAGAAESLSRLGRELCAEASRRAKRLLEAGELWKARTLAARDLEQELHKLGEKEA